MRIQPSGSLVTIEEGLRHTYVLNKVHVRSNLTCNEQTEVSFSLHTCSKISATCVPQMIWYLVNLKLTPNM